MILANDGTIAITRGDCGSVTVEIMTVDTATGDETAYEMGAEDTIELTVRERPSAEYPVLLHKVSEPGSTQIVLHSADTQIAPGRYSADIQLNRGGCRDTIWPEDAATNYTTRNRKNFIIGAEVTIDE